MTRKLWTLFIVYDRIDLAVESLAAQWIFQHGWGDVPSAITALLLGLPLMVLLLRGGAGKQEDRIVQSDEDTFSHRSASRWTRSRHHADELVSAKVCKSEGMATWTSWRG